MFKKILIFFIQLLLLIVIYQIGNQVTRVFHLQIPGNVIGMMILLLLLMFGVIKIDQIEMAAGSLIKHLGFFFIPISVGLMTIGHALISKGTPLLFILVISVFIGLLSAGKTTQAVIMKKEKVRVNNHDHAL